MPGPAWIDVQSQQAGATIEVRVAGEIDIATIADLAAPIAEALVSGQQTLVIDLQDVEFLDTQCIDLLAETLQKTTLMGIRLRVLPPDGPARRAIDVAFPLILGKEARGSSGRPIAA